MKDIENIRGKTKNKAVVFGFLKQEGAKPFHQTTVPKLSEKNVSDRLRICDVLGEWDPEDFLFLSALMSSFILATRFLPMTLKRIWEILDGLRSLLSTAITPGEAANLERARCLEISSFLFGECETCSYIKLSLSKTRIGIKMICSIYLST